MLPEDILADGQPERGGRFRLRITLGWRERYMGRRRGRRGHSGFTYHGCCRRALWRSTRRNWLARRTFVTGSDLVA